MHLCHSMYIKNTTERLKSKIKMASASPISLDGSYSFINNFEYQTDLIRLDINMLVYGQVFFVDGAERMIRSG